MTDSERELLQALGAVWDQCVQLPDDDEAFSKLTPDQRRNAHDLGLRCQDRLVRALSRLVVDMSTDGADLVDSAGLPQGYQEPGPEPEL